MALTKRAALKALGQKIRQRHGFRIDGSLLLGEEQIEQFIKSAEAPYKRFAEAYKGIEFRPGGHPDYDYLIEPENIGDTKEGVITTLFLDLKNFTKYCRLLSRENVYKAKAVVIAAVINVCWMYGGHLHEIPGDGVLFFFGHKNQEPLDAALQALQAACDAMAFLEEDIVPEYNDEDIYPDIYPKMGIDYGSVLWGAYGCDPYYEVKATAFNVDIASKMMCQCNSKQIAIGNDLKEFVNVDEEKYLAPGWKYERSLTVQGEKSTVCYQTWIFSWRIFRREEMDEDLDLSNLGIVGPTPIVSRSKSKLGNAPLA